MPVKTFYLSVVGLALVGCVESALAPRQQSTPAMNDRVDPVVSVVSPDWPRSIAWADSIEAVNVITPATMLPGSRTQCPAIVIRARLLEHSTS